MHAWINRWISICLGHGMKAVFYKDYSKYRRFQYRGTVTECFMIVFLIVCASRILVSDFVFIIGMLAKGSIGYVFSIFSLNGCDCIDRSLWCRRLNLISLSLWQGRVCQVPSLYISYPNPKHNCKTNNTLPYYLPYAYLHLCIQPCQIPLLPHRHPSTHTQTLLQALMPQSSNTCQTNATDALFAKLT